MAISALNDAERRHMGIESRRGIVLTRISNIVSRAYSMEKEENEEIGNIKIKIMQNRIGKIIYYLEQIGLSDVWHKPIHTEENIKL